MQNENTPITETTVATRTKCDPTKQKAIRKEMADLYGRIATGVRRRHAASWTTTRDY